MLNLETEYLNPAQIPEYLRHCDLWAREAATYRELARGRSHLDLPYGEKVRQRLDIFAPADGADGPVALFIHGGFWQMLDKSSFSHMARGANEHGIVVAVAGYTLCPEATLEEIVTELRSAVAFIAKRFGKPVTVYGHSAGGHLVACLLATDWTSVDPSLPKDTVSRGLSISGVFELEPLVSTSLNALLKLTLADARRLSPSFWHAPANRCILAYVGGAESSEYFRQTRSLVTRWRALGVEAVAIELAGATHFTVLTQLTEPTSSMVLDLAQLAKRR